MNCQLVFLRIFLFCDVKIYYIYLYRLFRVRA